MGISKVGRYFAEGPCTYNTRLELASLATSQKPFCGRPKLSNVRPLWVNIAHCPSVPRHPPKTQSFSKLSEGLKFAYTSHHTIENHLNIIDELYAILCGGRKKVNCNSYVGCGTKAPVGQNVSRTMRFSAPISVTVYNISSDNLELSHTLLHYISPLTILKDCVIYFFGRPPFHQGGDHQKWLTKIWPQKGRVAAKRFLTCTKSLK